VFFFSARNWENKRFFTQLGLLACNKNENAKSTNIVYPVYIIFENAKKNGAVAFFTH
jgi:hypothetical protein